MEKKRKQREETYRIEEKVAGQVRLVLGGLIHKVRDGRQTPLAIIVQIGKGWAGRDVDRGHDRDIHVEPALEQGPHQILHVKKLCVGQAIVSADRKERDWGKNETPA